MIDIPVPIPTLDGKGVAETVVVKVPAVYDADIKDYVLEDEAVATIDAAKARHMGLLLPEELRRLRAGLSLTQREMSELLQLGEKTYTRWESGRERPTRSLNILLRALWDGRLTPEYLRVIRTTRPRPHPASRAPIAVAASAASRRPTVSPRPVGAACA